jgi:hypothetical protein
VEKARQTRRRGAKEGDRSTRRPLRVPPILRRLARILGPEGSLHGAAGGLSRLRVWAAVAIVVVSVASALAVLKASVYDEEASQEDAVYRQQLLTRQQADRSSEEAVAEDLFLFGGYEQQVLRARDLRRGAAALSGVPRLAAALRRRAERERAIAAALVEGFRVALPAAGRHGAPAFNPSFAYWSATHSPQALEADVGPRRHRLAARAARRDGERMAVVAAIFLLALLFLTLAQVYAGTKAPKQRHPGEKVADVSPSVLRRAYALFGTGAVTALLATAFALLFVV